MGLKEILTNRRGCLAKLVCSFSVLLKLKSLKRFSRSEEISCKTTQQALQLSLFEAFPLLLFHSEFLHETETLNNFLYVINLLKRISFSFNQMIIKIIKHNNADFLRKRKKKNGKMDNSMREDEEELKIIAFIAL